MCNGNELLFSNKHSSVGRIGVNQVNLIGSDGFALLFKAVVERQMTGNIQLLLQPGVEDMPGSEFVGTKIRTDGQVECHDASFALRSAYTGMSDSILVREGLRRTEV